MFGVFFFFSSRRRHTRSLCDWSSDVCSSDLEVSLHLKLPGDLPLDEAHRVAEEVERGIRGSVPEVDSVQTHIEPLAEESRGHVAEEDEPEREDVERIVRATTGEPPRDVRFLHTDEGLVAHLTLAVDPAATLAQAHARASEVEHAIRTACVRIADVIVHTEP